MITLVWHGTVWYGIPVLSSTYVIALLSYYRLSSCYWIWAAAQLSELKWTNWGPEAANTDDYYNHDDDWPATGIIIIIMYSFLKNKQSNSAIMLDKKLDKKTRQKSATKNLTNNSTKNSTSSSTKNLDKNFFHKKNHITNVRSPREARNLVIIYR